MVATFVATEPARRRERGFAMEMISRRFRGPSLPAIYAYEPWIAIPCKSVDSMLNSATNVGERGLEISKV